MSLPSQTYHTPILEFIIDLNKILTDRPNVYYKIKLQKCLIVRSPQLFMCCVPLLQCLMKLHIADWYCFLVYCVLSP